MRVSVPGLTAGSLADLVDSAGGLATGGGSVRAGGEKASPVGALVPADGVGVNRFGVRGSGVLTDRAAFDGIFGIGVRDSSSKPRIIGDFGDDGGVLE